MAKQFNVNGRCYSKKHYMVNLEKRLSEIKGLVDAVIFMSFQELSESDFQNEYRFVSAFAQRFIEVIDDSFQTVSAYH